MATTKRKWSQHVTETSDAMDVAKDTFKSAGAKTIAETVERDSEKSNRRKESPYRAAMSMLTFYINRAGKNLTPERRRVLEHAKEILRDEFGPDAAGSTKPKSAARKTAARKTTTARKTSPTRKKTATRAAASTSRKKTTARKRG